jgi:Protein of unknown function (DUF551)
MNNWINVFEKLPNDGEQVLIYHNFKNIIKKDGTPERFDCATFHKGEIKTNNWGFCDVGFSNNKYPWAWRNGAMTYESQYVSYWMPLPEAPCE